MLSHCWQLLPIVRSRMASDSSRDLPLTPTMTRRRPSSFPTSSLDTLYTASPELVAKYQTGIGNDARPTKTPTHLPQKSTQPRHSPTPLGVNARAESCWSVEANYREAGTYGPGDRKIRPEAPIGRIISGFWDQQTYHF